MCIPGMKTDPPNQNASIQTISLVVSDLVVIMKMSLLLVLFLELSSFVSLF